MSYTDTIEYLYGLQKHGMKFGLDNIRRLLSELGNPHETFRAVHVAGTNGKGSTAALVESMLRTAGLTTGLFTSPHIVSFSERIRINGEEIGEDEIINLADEIRSVSMSIEDFSPTFFEVVTAMAFMHFKKMNVAWAVVEVGMGGRLDATNILVPELCVITNIGLDHREFLGSTVKEIAREKAGIIKKRVPVITAEQGPEALEVLERYAAESGSPLYRENTDFSALPVAEGHDGIIFDYLGNRTYKSLKLPLSGKHQVSNAALAIKAVEIASVLHPGISCDISRGIGSMRWPGRLELIKTDPPVLIDGAHNPAAARALSAHLGKLLSSQYRRLIVILGIMNDKDIEGILKPLLPLASEVLFTTPEYGRAASPEMLEARARSLGYRSRKTSCVGEALTRAESIYREGDLIVVTGSFYTIGEAKEALVHKGVLARLRE